MQLPTKSFLLYKSLKLFFFYIYSPTPVNALHIFDQQQCNISKTLSSKPYQSQSCLVSLVTSLLAEKKKSGRKKKCWYKNNWINITFDNRSWLDGLSWHVLLFSTEYIELIDSLLLKLRAKSKWANSPPCWTIPLSQSGEFGSALQHTQKLSLEGGLIHIWLATLLIRSFSLFITSHFPIHWQRAQI